MSTDSMQPTHSEPTYNGRKIVNRLLEHAGARLTSNRRRLNLGDAMRHLALRGVKPSTLIDVGVAWGTPDLYEAFPEAALVLVEPNPQWQPGMEKILRRKRGSAFVCAAGAEEAELELHVWHGAEGSSSFDESSLPADADRHSVKVPVQRVDKICSDANAVPPYVVKVDVQGHEAAVIQGCEGILNQTEALVVETSLYDRSNSGLFAIMEMMHRRGWELYDIVGLNYRPRDSALAQVDAVFAPSRGLLRDSDSWH